MNDNFNFDRIQAVVFDLGGVFLQGGPSVVAEFGPLHGMERDVWEGLRRELFIDGDHWDRVERAEGTLDEFAETLRGRMSDHGIELTLEQARNFMRSPGSEDGMPLRPEVVEMCLRLNSLMPTALLTNNVAEWCEGWRGRFDLDALFDVVIDSSVVGMRKPEPRIYELTEQRLGLPGKNLLFVDDIGSNLKAALKRDWQTLKYDDTRQVLGVLDTLANGRTPRR